MAIAWMAAYKIEFKFFASIAVPKFRPRVDISLSKNVLRIEYS